MKFLIWGTGRVAEEFLSGVAEYIEEYIVAFVDNDPNKWGKTFYKKKIISPEQIINCDFDKVLIWNTYESEVRGQMIGELGIQKSQIIGVLDSNNLVFDLLNKKFDLLKRKFIVIGDVNNYMPLKALYEDVLTVVGFVDVQHLEEIYDYEYDYILFMNLMNVSGINRENGKLYVENEIKTLLMEKYGVDTIMFTDEVFRAIQRADRVLSTEGRENADKTFLVIQLAGRLGLGTFVMCANNSIKYAVEKGYIPVVDLMTYPNQYLTADEIGHANAWEKFFEQPAGYRVEDVMKSSNVYATVSKFMPSQERKLLYIEEKPDLLENSNRYMEKVGWNKEKILGVLVRGTDYTNKRPYAHPIQPEVSMVIQAVRRALKEWKYDRIYLCTEVEEVIEMFSKEFGDCVLYYSQNRFRQDSTEYLSDYKFECDNDVYHRGADYWCALKVLSQCDSLIAGNCGGAEIALFLNNGAYKHTYIFDLGKYGIDDVKLNDKAKDKMTI